MNIDKYDKIEREDGVIILTPKKEDLDWFPGRDGYWFLEDDGRVSSRNNQMPSSRFVSDRLRHQNVFETKSQAEKASKLQRVSNAIIRACLLVDPDYEPDWSTGEIMKYLPYWSCTSSSWVVDYYGCARKAPAHVSTREKAEQVCALLTKWDIKP